MPISQTDSHFNNSHTDMEYYIIDGVLEFEFCTLKSCITVVCICDCARWIDFISLSIQVTVCAFSSVPANTHKL